MSNGNTTLILEILLAIVKALRFGGEVTDEKQKELTRQIEEEMAKLNS
jgi:hypothetical protein